MDQPNARYNFPKSQVADQLTSWNDFVVIGRDTNGKPHILASGDERATQDLLNKVRVAEPASG